MAEQAFNPTALLGGYLKETNPDQAVKLARELCSQLEGDPESFHGAVWPGNVDLDVDGKAVLGPGSRTPANERPADQVEYLAPEFFWDGSGSAAADVYSVGLLLYAGCNGGYLPFQPRDGELTDKARSDALRRRMKGEAIAAPEGVSDELKKVMEKALAYEPEDRYITAKELLTAIGRTDEALPSAEAAGAAAAGAAAVGAAAGIAAAAGAVDDEAPEAAQDGGEPQVQELGAESAPQETPADGTPDQETPAGEEGAQADDFVFGDEPKKDDKAAAAAAAAVAGAAAAGAAVKAAGKKKNGKKSAAEAKDSGRVQSAAPKADAAGAKHAASGGARPQARPQYKVQKDFESTPRAQRRVQSVVPASQKRKKRSAAIPVLCGMAAAVILGSVGYGLLSRKNPVESDLYTPEDNIEAPAPVVVTIAPTEEPSPSPRPTPRPTATPAATPEVVLDAEGNVIAVIGGTGAGASATTGTGTATGTGTGTNTTTGTGAGSGTGTGSGTTGSGSGTGSGTGSSGSGSGWSGGGSSSGGSSGWTGGGSSSGGNSGWSGGGSSSVGGSSSGGSSSGGGSSSNGGYSGPVDAANDTVYITGNLLRVRRGPGLNYAVFGWVNVGDKLPRTGTVNGWSQVKYQGQVGYVSNDYVTTTDPSATPTPAVPPAVTASPSPTPASTPTPSPAPTASPVPTPTYTATAEDKKYSDLQDSSLATIASQEEMDAVVKALSGNSSLSYAWVSVTKESDGWKSGGTAISASFWKEGHPVDGNDWALLEKQADGSWKLISVKSEGFDAASDTYKGKIGYVTKTTA